MKTCNVCKIEKPLNDFCNKKMGKLGKSSVCKICTEEKRLEKKHSIIGILKYMYNSQKQNSKKRNYPLPSYSCEEFIKWAINDTDFNKIFKNWVKSNFEKNLVPSVDRINDYVSYEFGNIRLVTWKENKEKYNVDRVLGINNKQNQEVYKYSIDGKFIEKYSSVRSAARENKCYSSGIIFCYQGKLKQHKGFVWKRKEV